MKTFRIFLLLLIMMLFNQCKDETENTILIANREAPLGWNYLKIYKNKTFEFVVSGIRDKTVYPGTVKISNDTLYFNYLDSIPKVGKTAILKDNYVIYLDGKYSEQLNVRLDSISK